MWRRRLTAVIVNVVALAAVGAASVPAGGSTGPPGGAAEPRSAATPDEARYLFHLRGDDQGDRWRGSAVVTFTNTGDAPLPSVWLRLWGNGGLGCGQPAVQVTNVRGGSAGEQAVDCTALPVTLPRPLPPGRSTALGFDVAIDVPERADRFGRVGEYSFLGNALPVLAVRDERGWQLPPYVANAESFYSLTSSYDVILDHPARLAVPATGTAQTVPLGTGRAITRVQAPRVRDFAWAAGPFQEITTTTTTGVRLRTWRGGDVTEDQAREVQGWVRAAMEFYTGEYGAYPYPEMDTVIGGFEGFAGMEYPTLILTEPEQMPAVHEAAHQWWYALVGNDQYHHPWLDESLTHYATTKIIGIPSYCAGAPFWFSEGMRIDAGMDYYDSRREEYSPGIYGDGSCMFHELERTVGPDAMREALRSYLSRHRYGVARPDDLRAAFTEASGRDLDAFWERWRNTGD